MWRSMEAGITPEWSTFGGEFSQKLQQLTLIKTILVCLHYSSCVFTYILLMYSMRTAACTCTYIYVDVRTCMSICHITGKRTTLVVLDCSAMPEVDFAIVQVHTCLYMLYAVVYIYCMCSRF